MPTIAEENTKILRRSLDVMVGMDIPFVDVSSVTASGEYAGASGNVNGAMQEPVLMALSNGGFLNDGLAVPLGDDTDGFVAQIGTNLVLTVTLDSASDDDLIVIGFIGGEMHKWTFSGSGASRTVTIPGNTERIIVNRVVCGEAFWFDNSNLVSCTLQLRSVDTKVDNPELQMSEIEIEGYEPNDITDIIGYIGTGYPITYTSGYPGDMAPTRQFYLGEPIEYEDKVVTIKGYDATYLLDDEYPGKGIEYVMGNNNGGLIRYTKEIDSMLTNANIPHSFVQDPQYEDYVRNFNGYIFIDKQPKRSIIAWAVNCFRTDSGSDAFVINYVDAGIPKLWTGKDTSNAVTLENISRPTVIVDPAVKSVAMNVYEPMILSSALIETVDSAGAAIYETSDPYYTFSASGGTITYLSPYSYKLVGTGSINVSGRKINLWATTEVGYGPYLPLIETSGNSNGVDIEIGDASVESYDYKTVLQQLLSRSNISYEFQYRGDPNLQPRDYIRADIDGSGTLVDMTIDTIELKHEGGGTSSTIVARKGFI